MLSLRQENKVKPYNMAELDFPHKKRKTEFKRLPNAEIDKFNKTVGYIRGQLNKLSESNFETIQETIIK
jgi:hypothetical protein